MAKKPTFNKRMRELLKGVDKETLKAALEILSDAYDTAYDNGWYDAWDANCC